MMKIGSLTPAAVLSAVFVASVGLGSTQTAGLGIFTNEGGIGNLAAGSEAHYDHATGEYRITGGGADLWGANDGLYFVWKQASGDMTLSADVRWIGTGHAHRMAVLMMRQSLEPGSAYADVDSRGDGHTLIQFRGVANDPTYQITTPVEGPSRLRLVRKRGVYTMFLGNANEDMKLAGTLERVSLKDPIYVGLGVCSHLSNDVTTAIFSNVSLEMNGAGT